MYLNRDNASRTRELFLTHTVRTHRKLRQAVVDAQLQVFEGKAMRNISIRLFRKRRKRSKRQVDSLRCI